MCGSLVFYCAGSTCIAQHSQHHPKSVFGCMLLWSFEPLTGMTLECGIFCCSQICQATGQLEVTKAGPLYGNLFDREKRSPDLSMTCLFTKDAAMQEVVLRLWNRAETSWSKHMKVKVSHGRSAKQEMQPLITHMPIRDRCGYCKTLHASRCEQYCALLGEASTLISDNTFAVLW